MSSINSSSSRAASRFLVGRSGRKSRRGAIAVLTGFLLVFFLGLIVLAIDSGMLLVARTELRRLADAAALASCSELLEQRIEGSINQTTIRETAAEFAKNNKVRLQGPDVELNADNAAGGEVLIGYVADVNNPTSLDLTNSSRFNATQVRVTRSLTRNGEVTLFFARIWGINSGAVQADAYASFIDSFRGFRVPEPTKDPPENLMLLPITVSLESWQAALNGSGNDDYSWDGEKEKVTGSGDGIKEVNLFPIGNGSGNWGLLDIGSSKSSNATIASQIENGMSSADLAYHGGEIALNSSGQLNLSGNTGISVGAMEGAMEAAIGQARIIPLYDGFSGSGQNAEYTIVKFAGGRIMSVKLTGGNKHLIVQPGPILTRGGIPSDDGDLQSTQVYSPVRLTH